MLVKKAITRFRNRLYRTKHSIWVPMVDKIVPVKRNVFAVVGNEKKGHLCIPGSNIVGDAGDRQYAQIIAGGTPTNAFDVMVLGSAGNSPNKTSNFGSITEIAATEKAFDAGYPTTNDGDADNTGTTGIDVVTYRVSWTKADFTAPTITDGVITNATPGASEPVLTHWKFASAFEKTADDTLKVFVNHEQLGQ